MRRRSDYREVTARDRSFARVSVRLEKLSRRDDTNSLPASWREVSEVSRHQVPGLSGKGHLQKCFVIGIRQPMGKGERRHQFAIGFKLLQQCFDLEWMERERRPQEHLAVLAEYAGIVAQPDRSGGDEAQDFGGSAEG